jgi:ubiquinol-cytochrome c reductase cytochrome c1 subunit
MTKSVAYRTPLTGWAAWPALTFLLTCSLLTTNAAGAEPELERANNDVADVASLQRGARNFVNYCMGCHSAKYVRYNRLASDLELSQDQLVTNLMFAAEKPDETMSIAMPEADALRWFGQVPPDLTLIARSKGTDYLYGFLRSFYLDDTGPTGVDNRLLSGTSMPHVLWELQGLQRAAFEEVEREDGTREQHFIGFETVTPGTMSADEFDGFVRDIVNFLEYTGSPEQLDSRRVGTWVIAFLLVFLLLAYLLKNEYWKDVK